MNKLTVASRSLWAKKDKGGNTLWLPLYQHLADSAALAKKLWNKWLSPGVQQAISANVEGGDAQLLFIFLAAVHDIGKATPVFQAKSAYPENSLDRRITENIKQAGLPIKPADEFTTGDKTPHALATQILLEEAGFDRSIAAILGGHHGKPPDSEKLDRRGIDSYPKNYHLEREGKRAWTAVQQELIAYALRLANFSSPDELPLPDLSAQVLLCGLVIMTDWLASNNWYFPYYRLEDKPESTENRLNTAWRRLKLPQSWNARNDWMTDDLYKERFGFRRQNNMQAAVRQAAGEVSTPGILVLEAPMGAGKTEAALAAAEIFADRTGRTGIFFALPTQATSDGMFHRITDWMERLNDGLHTISLAHGKAQFNKDYLSYLRGSTGVAIDEKENNNSAMVHQWFEGKKKSLLADFVIGTVDQLLMAALKQKHVMLRHLGLANKVVIIDECHAYDAYMSQYLDMALRWLGAYHVPVIVLSATLPTQRRQAVVDAYNHYSSLADQQDIESSTASISSAWTQNRAYPLITYTDGRQIKQISIPHEGPNRYIKLESLYDGLADMLQEKLSSGGCAGVIVNTVARAQTLAQELRQRFGADTVILLHSRFLAPDRAEKERTVLAKLGKPGKEVTRPDKCIIVGTQVLEQSLDIDFDLLVTDLCPMDLLLQRIGRLHRHERERPVKLRQAQCFIMGAIDEEIEPSTKSIYGQYMLLRTRALLPKGKDGRLATLCIPDNIPNLVQDAYDPHVKLMEEPSGYRQAQAEWEAEITRKQQCAETFRLNSPWPGPGYSMVNWLNTDISDQQGEAAVRDTDESFEVLLIQQREGALRFLPWIEQGRTLMPHEAPTDEDARTLAQQSVRLPHALCAPWAIKATINELEDVNNKLLSSWQQSPWLRGELFLIVDESGTAKLGDYRLHYDKDDGLKYEKEVDVNG